jgi:hypothetical protein
MDDELEKYGRKWLWPSLKVVKWNFPEVIKENYENPQSGSPVPRPRFEMCALKMRVGSLSWLSQRDRSYGPTLKYFPHSEKVILGLFYAAVKPTACRPTYGLLL